MRQSWNDVKPQFPETQATSASAILLEEIYKLEHLQNELAQDANRALEAVQKEVECLCLTQTDMNQEAAMSVAKLQSEINEIYESRTTGASAQGVPLTKENDEFCSSLKEEIQRVASKDIKKVGDADTIENMLAQMQIKLADFGVPTLISEQQNKVDSNINECDLEGFNQQDHLKSAFAIHANMQSQAGKTY